MLLFFSLLLVALGQSAWVPMLSIGAASCGYALFWRAMLRFPSQKTRFWLSVAWFAAVQAVQLSWMTSTQYMGPLILVVYLFLIFALGLQFGLLSFFLDATSIALRGCFAVAGGWVLMEWIRLFFFSGFTWNPVALSLADSSLAIQFAAIAGVYGLSFWVIFVNALAVRAERNWKRGAVWAACAAFPYLFGLTHQAALEHLIPPQQTVHVALVQTALKPEQKGFFPGQGHALVPPLQQWRQIWDSLRDDMKPDLIVLPEAVVSIDAYTPFYPIHLAQEAWAKRFGKEALIDLPPLEEPLAALAPYNGRTIWKVSNAFFAQALANHFQASVIAGFEDQKYNAAFQFDPGKAPQRMEKRVLVPIGEYLPFPNFQWLTRFFIEQFGIGDSLRLGKEAKLFHGKMAIGPSICLEETYSDLIRDLRLKGADLLVNVTNDVWFPSSRLPQQHFQHGRIRAAEHGVPVLRACNTGVTGAIDCFGNTIAALTPSETERKVLYLSFQLRHFPTFYTWTGDWAILGFSLICLLSGLLPRKKM